MAETQRKANVTNVTNATLDKDSAICFNGSMETTNSCQCGCGAQVARRYLPGHDARHKAAIVARANDESSTRQACDRAIDELIALGWTRYADMVTLRAYKQRVGRIATTHRADVSTWLVGPDGVHHARHSCKALTASAREVGLIHGITRLAMQAAITRTTEQPTGWDGCQRCSHENTLDELVEHWDVGRQITLAIYDELGLSKLGNAKPSKKAKTTPAPVEPAPVEPVGRHRSRLMAAIARGMGK